MCYSWILRKVLVLSWPWVTEQDGLLVDSSNNFGHHVRVGQRGATNTNVHCSSCIFCNILYLRQKGLKIQARKHFHDPWKAFTAIAPGSGLKET